MFNKDVVVLNFLTECAGSTQTYEYKGDVYGRVGGQLVVADSVHGE